LIRTERYGTDQARKAERSSTMPPASHEDRTYAVTGAASGIGAAVAAYLRASGARVIACDLTSGDACADLATVDGRARLVETVGRLCGGRLSGIVANAGGGPVKTMLALNYFGAVATLDGLRPLLDEDAAPRALAVSSVSSLGEADLGIVEACLSGDEAAAEAAAAKALAGGMSPLDLYGVAKHALNRWCRRAAPTDAWAGAGIPLNAVAPGVIETPAAGWILNNQENQARMRAMTPLPGACPGKPEAMAALIAWCVSPENALLSGQVLFADGGLECRARGETRW
jgi:NAD(P)-dependent dehydrogenase (short-subunit alcohol dehydrogenase family)